MQLQEFENKVGFLDGQTEDSVVACGHGQSRALHTAVQACTRPRCCRLLLDSIYLLLRSSLEHSTPSMSKMTPEMA